MKKKHKSKHARYRNAAPRDAAPRPAPRTSRGDTSLTRLGYTAAGAAGTALIGSFLAHEGWAPKTIATALATVGAGLAWKGDSSMIQSLGAGAMSAAGSQLALMVIDDRGRKREPPSTVKKPANADALPPGALEAALERARSRLAIEASERDAVG
jgi:hypothetical protein